MVRIFEGFFRQRKRFLFKKRQQDFSSVKRDLSELKGEMDDHLCAINENTNEIQNSFEYVESVSAKIDKLAERLERMELFLSTKEQFTVEEQQFHVKPLTRSEQHIFLVMYALEDEKGLVSYADVSRKTGFPSYMVSEYVTRLAEKGVPITRQTVNSVSYLKIHPEFKRLQAMENILNIDTAQKELMHF